MYNSHFVWMRPEDRYHYYHQQLQTVGEMTQFHQLPPTPSPPRVPALAAPTSNPMSTILPFNQSATALPQRSSVNNTPPADSPPTPLPSTQIAIKSEPQVCHKCSISIYDRYTYTVGGNTYHGHCLHCADCSKPMIDMKKCHTFQNRLLCREHYYIARNVGCQRCERRLDPADWVRRARESVYHLACFTCDTCDRQLSTGELFAMMNDQILCKEHYMETMEVESGSSDGSVNGATEKKSKRVRTAFTDEQMDVLNAHFDVDNNPDGQDLERIAVNAGLSKRVTQVWFQNSRARQKKNGKPKRQYELHGPMQPNMGMY